jgi:hypothetical protein
MFYLSRNIQRIFWIQQPFQKYEKIQKNNTFFHQLILKSNDSQWNFQSRIRLWNRNCEIQFLDLFSVWLQFSNHFLLVWVLIDEKLYPSSWKWFWNKKIFCHTVIAGNSEWFFLLFKSYNIFNEKMTLVVSNLY